MSSLLSGNAPVIKSRTQPVRQRHRRQVSIFIGPSRAQHVN